RNPPGGSSFLARLRCSLLTDPLRDMLVARALSGRKIPCRERHRIYVHDHLVALPPVPLSPSLPKRLPCAHFIQSFSDAAGFFFREAAEEIAETHAVVRVEGVVP